MAPGTCTGVTRGVRSEHLDLSSDRRDPVHRQPVAQWVGRAEDRPGEAAEGGREWERATSERSLRPHAREADPSGGRLGNRRSSGSGGGGQ